MFRCSITSILMRGVAEKNSTTANCIRMVILLVCFEPNKQFFSYQAAVTIVGERAVNLDLCSLTAFSSEGSFTCHTYCDRGPPFI
jgi:hypothetical protein